MKISFLVFLALQTADFLTTVIVLRLGGTESNPIVQHLMSADTVHGLLTAKLAAVAIGAICLMSGRHRALRMTNMALTTIVAWNVTIVARLL